VRMIDEGVRLLKKAAAVAEPGPYQLQAAIVACHSKAASFAETDWPPDPCVVRHVAGATTFAVDSSQPCHRPAQVVGPAAGLREVDALAESLTGYNLFHATRGRFLIELGRHEKARAAALKAAELTENRAEQQLLARRAHRLGHDGSECDSNYLGPFNDR
jgi:predicted RNA polymerase sigma factor